MLIRILITLSLLLAGFAFRAPIVNAEEYSVAYLLPDGTYASLCGTGDDSNAPNQHSNHPCELCLLACSLLLTKSPSSSTAPRTLAEVLRPNKRYDGPLVVASIERLRSRSPPRSA